ncbi:MAG: DNA polymerase IV [Bacillota bacterium]|nr:DNA polymerase IV [Bacillota bacterium]
MDRIIFHCDLNAFYASVELLSYPHLRQLPVAVCGDPGSRHGIILAKNEPAKALGVKTAETIWQARRKAPDLVLLPAHHDKYRYYSKLAGEIYRRYTDLVEPFGIDESWLDVTGTIHLFGGDPVALANRIREEMKQELGLTISVGVSFNKVFAKLGSDYKKPDAVTVISRENYRDLVWPLPVTDLLFVGRASARTLEAHNISTIGELAAADREELIRLLGKHGGQLHDYATGAERSPVRPAGTAPPPKSVGKGLTFRRNLTGEEEIRAGVRMLSERVAMGLRRHGMKCTTVQVAVRSPEFKTISRQRGTDAPTNVSREIMACAMDLIGRCWSWTSPVRAITVTASGLLPEEEAGDQLDLFTPGASEKREKQEKLERAMDRLRDKYGRHVVRFASNQTEAAREIRGDRTGEEPEDLSGERRME